jgi:hypothetical protein
MAGSLPATVTIRFSLVVKACAFFARKQRTVFALVPWTSLGFGWLSARFDRCLLKSAKLSAAGHQMFVADLLHPVGGFVVEI